MHTVELDDEDPGCLREEMVGLDDKTGKKSSASQGLTVDEEIMSVMGPTTSLASLRTASTEPYVLPPRSKGTSLQDGCVSSFKDDLQTSSQRPPVQKLEACNRDRTSSGRRLEISGKNPKKRKRSQIEPVTADVEGTIGRVISAAEAIVVGHLIDGLSLSPGQYHSIILEAALSLGKARNICGLDKFDLDGTTAGCSELDTRDLDQRSMLEAYADVGITVEAPEDERQHQSIGTAVVNSSQQNVEIHDGARSSETSPTEVGHPPQRIGGTISDVCINLTQHTIAIEDSSHTSDGQSGQVVAQHSEFGGIERNERSGDNVQVHRSRMQGVKKPRKSQPCAGISTVESSTPLNFDELLDAMSKQISPASKSVAVVSSSSELEIGDNVPVNGEINISSSQQDIELLQEMDAAGMERKAGNVYSPEVVRCQETSECRAVLSCRTIHTLEGESSEVDVDNLKTTSTVPTCIGQITCWPQENFERAVDQAPNPDPVIADISPNSDIFCGGFLLQSSSIVESIQHKAEYQEEIEGEIAMAMGTGLQDNKVAQPLETSEHLLELSLRPKAMAFSESNWSNIDVGKRPVSLGVPSVENSPRNLATVHVSRWLGGWPSNSPFNTIGAVSSLNDIGSEDAVPERNAFLAAHKNVSVGQECTAFRSVSVEEAVVVCFSRSDEATSEGPRRDFSPLRGSHSPALDLSQIDPLCSFVPCSISYPASVSLPSCHGDDRSSMLPATVEACARAAMNIIDSRKVADCEKTGAMELTSVPDPAVRKDNEASSEQIVESRIDYLPHDDVNVRRVPASMKKFSTTTNSLALLLHAVDIAGKSIPKKRNLEDGNQEEPSTRRPNVIGFAMGQVEQSANVDTQTAADLPDVAFTSNGKSLLKEKRMSNQDLWTCADLSDSPPLLWPRGKKRRLTACRVADSDSTEWLHDYAADNRMAPKDFVEKEQHTLQDEIQSGKLVLGTSTRSKSCLDSKSLFKGLQFLLTGFSSEKKEMLSKIVEQCGGELLSDVPRFSPKQRLKRQGRDCGARSPLIVIAPQQMRTHKYLYGCAVGAPLLDASWITASVSACKNLPYPRYHHKQTRADCILQTSIGSVSKGGESPLFVGFQFLFHGQKDFISQLSTLAKHAGGRVLRKLVLKGNERKQRQILVGLVVVEGSTNLPIELQRAASKLEYHVVDSEWMIVSLLKGKLLPFATNATPPSCVLPSQQSSASKAGEPLHRYSRRRVHFQPENPESREDRNSGIELLVKKLKQRSLPEENRPSSCTRSKLSGKELVEQGHVLTCWLGKGFTSPPKVPQLTDRLLGAFSHVVAHKNIPKKSLYYEAFVCDGVEYSLGDIVEVRDPTADCPPSVDRIEGVWSEEDGRRLPQTRAFKEGVRKKAIKNVVLKCRRFYRPSDTGFPGKEGSSTTNELYLSNDFDNKLASDILKRVRVKLETASGVVHCRNWCDEVVDDQKRVAGSSVYRKKGTSIARRAADYFCNFFYDHVGESLHRIKLQE